MNDEELSQRAREALEAYPIGLRLSLLGVVGETLKDHARKEGIPPEEVVTDELIEDEALMVVKHVLGAVLARFEEFVSEEARGRILEEEFERLVQGRPDGRVSEGELQEAVMERVRRAYPHVFSKFPGLGRGRRRWTARSGHVVLRLSAKNQSRDGQMVSVKRRT